MRELLLNNFWWKVTALLLAVGAWLGLSQEQYKLITPTTTVVPSTRELVQHPITIIKEAADTREFKVTPSEVDITISSRNLEDLRELDGRDVSPRVDLREWDTNATTAEVVVVIPEMKERGLELLKLVPDRVQVELVKD